jgi:hypothetical protein
LPRSGRPVRRTSGVRAFKIGGVPVYSCFQSGNPA